MAAPCAECREIAEAIQTAYAEAWNSGTPEFRDTWQAVYRMIGGTEEDFERAEALLRQYRIQPPGPDLWLAQAHSPIGRALRRKLAHESFSGHKIPNPPPIF